MRVYIAGPMRGYPEFNFPAFDSLAAYVRNVLKWATVNPADHDREAALAVKGVSDITTVDGYAEGDLKVYEHTLGQVYDLLTWDTARIAEDCDGIVMLPGWEKSTGAKYERAVAESLDKSVWLASRVQAGPGYFTEWLLTPDYKKRISITVLENASV